MNDWTVERLDAMHEGTSVAIWEGGSVFTKDSAGDPARPWAFSRGGRESSAGLIRESRHPDTGRGWIRAVSAPVDALLTVKTLQAVNNQVMTCEACSSPDQVINAAIEYVTGETDS